MTTQRINAWSSPRNISTALMYAFAQRKDTKVVDEPLYAHYLAKSGAASFHPGAADIMASQSQVGEEVVRDVLLAPYEQPVVFFKQMTHHLIELDEGFLGQMEHLLLIRDPRAIIASYAKVIPAPSMRDVGVEQQYRLFEQLKNMGKLKAVVDARELLLHPAGVLRQLCERLQLAYEPGMLRWPKGARAEDGVWAKHWYANVHQSEGFQPYRERKYELSAELEELAEACRPYYEALLGEALRA